MTTCWINKHISGFWNQNRKGPVQNHESQQAPAQLVALRLVFTRAHTQTHAQRTAVHLCQQILPPDAKSAVTKRRKHSTSQYKKQKKLLFFTSIAFGSYLLFCSISFESTPPIALTSLRSNVHKILHQCILAIRIENSNAVTKKKKNKEKNRKGKHIVTSSFFPFWKQHIRSGS